MTLRIILYLGVLAAILYLTAPHLGATFRLWQGVKNSPKPDELTLKLVKAVLLSFSDKVFIGSYLILLSVLSILLPDHVRQSWWYVIPNVLLFALGLIPSAYAHRSWWVSFTEVVDRHPQEVGDQMKAVVAMAAETLMTAVMGSSRDAIILADTERNILAASDGVTMMLGYTNQEVVGCKLEILLPEEYREYHPRHVASFVDGTEQTREMGARRPVFARHKDGTAMEVKVTISKSEILAGVQLLVAIMRAVPTNSIPDLDPH